MKIKPSNQISLLAKCYFTILFSVIGFTALAIVFASSPRSQAAEQATSATASVTVSAVCTMTGTENKPHTATLMNGNSQENIGKTTLKSFCNDASGYSIYAVGYTGDKVGETALHSDSLGETYDIQTGTSGTDSRWAMKVSSVAGTYAPSIDNGFDNYHIVPNKYTRVAYLGNSTDATIGSSVETTYSANISATQPAGTYQGKVKYILVHPSGSTPEEIPAMQNVAKWKETLLENEEITVVDKRDNQTYTVAKLCVNKNSTTGACDDYQIWMTQNSNFAPDPNVTYTHADTDLGYTTGDSSATWTPLASTMTNPAVITNFASGNPANSLKNWVNDANLPYYAEGRLADSSGSLTTTEIIMYNGTKYEGMTACTKAGHTASQCEHYKVGNYYNWPAAIASNDASDISADYAVAPNSVCPAGWRLPQGPTASLPSEFNKLLYANNVTNNLTDYTGTNIDVQYATDGFTKINTAPLYFARSGRVYDTTLYYFTWYGLYWSSSTVNGSYAYRLRFDSSVLYPADQSYRGDGYSLRCVAR